VRGRKLCGRCQDCCGKSERKSPLVLAFTALTIALSPVWVRRAASFT
jgi:hypothetical protein